MRYVDATGLATTLMGDAIATNFFVVGAALQLGWLPVGRAAIEQALALNGTQVEFNLRALRYGRLWAHDPAAIARVLGAAAPAPLQAEPPTLDALLADRVQRLTDYQNDAYAKRYQSLLTEVRAAERRVAGSEGAFSRAVAQQFARLMMVKDEYEVARLYSSPAFKAQLNAEFDGVTGLRFHLAPPLLAKRDPATGHLLKREYGPWMLAALGWLARFKGLRGTALDVFGRTEERRMERALIDDYERRIRALLPALDAARLPLAVQIAEVAEQVRGFGHVKERQVKLARAAWDRLDALWRAPGVVPELAKAA